MARTSPQGLTIQDFHHQAYVNPLDVFPTKSRLGNRSQNHRSPMRDQAKSRNSSRFPSEHKFACCDEEPDLSFHPPGGLDCCLDHGSDDIINFDQPSLSCCDESHHSSPSPMDCEDCVDDCDDCVEEHLKAKQRPCNCVPECDECDECDEEKQTQCPDNSACQDVCDECDFSCFDCVDWTEFERDKNLGLSFSVPLLDDNGFTASDFQVDNIDMSEFQSFNMPNTQSDITAPPLDVPMHHQCFGNTVPCWNNVVQDQLCNGNPGLSQQLPLPAFGLDFGCHPAVAHQQTHRQTFTAANPLDLATALQPQPSTIPPVAPPKDPLNNTQDLFSAITGPSTSRACQWIMPCGTVCGASFATGTDLKKHLKSVHLVKGVTKCHWQDCDSPDFGSEAALTGHISKKHLASMLTSSSSPTSSHKHKHHTHEGPFKCTFPNCPKSFTYKHIRDEHVATHHGGNRMYCPICHVYLNGEGSNFKRHMATHRPKHQHMLCKYHGLGCKRRFPRLDNLRRHEACCKFGKKAKAEGLVVDGAHHHHHHHVHT